MSGVKDEMRHEELARRYGERLLDSQLGPYAGFSREQYFRHKCDTAAGEFIYKTVDNVEGVFQMRQRDPRDYLTRLKNRDIPEDPWGHTDAEAATPWGAYLTKYPFFETTRGLRDRGDRWNRDVFAERPPSGESRYWRYRLGEPDGTQYLNNRSGERFGRPLVAEKIDTLKSRYGYTWREVRDEYDRHFGVWGGEIIVKDLQTHETLAVKRGFFDTRFNFCPPGKSHYLEFEFVSKVLKPAKP
ncbi:MAG: hypothetical protein H6953_13970 [Chromatiaceae bacterium]|nr:hypothetical protein [Chromatiaceae bacterium]MCP5312098.1 hypothetical protein [Chromatiaceae bacterium]